MQSVDFTRYHRQMLLPSFGRVGQERLARSHVVIIGCGALGTVVAEQCVRAGVGVTTIVDRDLVDFTNLQRQTLFTEADARARRPKAEAAKERLALVNSTVRVRAWVEEFGPPSALRITEGATLLVDCLDNFESRLLLNDVAVQRCIPLVYGGAVGMRGMAALLTPHDVGPCFRCLVPELPPLGSSETCDSAGVLSSATGIAGSLESALVLRFLAGAGAGAGPGAGAASQESSQPSDALTQQRALANVLVRFDLADFSFGRTEISDAADPNCRCCRGRNFEFLNSTAPAARVLCGRDAVQVVPSRPAEEASFLERLAGRLVPHGSFALETGALRGQFASEHSPSGSPIGLVVFPDGRVIVEGTIEPDFARSIVSRFVGG